MGHLERGGDLLAPEVCAYRWDQRGAGRSERTGPYSVARSVADLEAVRRHFGLERPVLLGHSWGAQLALSYTLQNPHRVGGLVYVSGTGIDPVSTWTGQHKEEVRRRLADRGLLARWGELRERASRSPDEDRQFCVLQWSTDFEDPQTAVRQAEAMATPWWGAGVNFEANAALNAEIRSGWGAPELRDRCGTLHTVPVLVVDGARDPRPRSSIDSLVTVLPRVTRAVLPDAGHLPWAEDPHGFRAAVTGFLAEAVVLT